MLRRVQSIAAFVAPTLVGAGAASAQNMSPVTTAPFTSPAPVASAGGLIVLALVMTAIGWYSLRNRRVSDFTYIAVAALVATTWAVAIHAIVPMVTIQGGDCFIKKTNTYIIQDETILKSECPDPISVVALENPCSQSNRCEVGTVLRNGDQCNLPTCD